MELFVLLLWAVFAVIVGVAASDRGRSGLGWFLFSFLLSPLIGAIAVALLPNNKELAVSDLRHEEQMAALSSIGRAGPVATTTTSITRLSSPVGTTLKKCPDCAEQVQAEARICRFCRYEFPPSAMPEPRLAPTPIPERVEFGRWRTINPLPNLAEGAQVTITKNRGALEVDSGSYLLQVKIRDMLHMGVNGPLLHVISTQEDLLLAPTEGQDLSAVVQQLEAAHRAIVTGP